LKESESFFNYSIDDTSYSAINDGYRSFIPNFSEDIVSGASTEIKEACMNDKQCIYDYVVTGNAEVAMSTYNISMANQDSVIELGEQRHLVYIAGNNGGTQSCRRELDLEK